MAKRILVPLDRSPVSETVVPIVGAMARGDGSTVRLLQVAPVPRTHLTEEGRILAYADQEMASLESHGLDYLRTIAAQLEGAGDVECTVRFGDPVEEILAEAEDFGADLIVVTTETRGTLRRAVLGSVADQVLRKAEAPVLLMRPGDADARCCG